MIKIWILCVHFEFNTIPILFLDRIGDDLSSLYRYFIILSCIIVQNIQNYVKIDHDCQNQNIIEWIQFIIKIWIFYVHYEFNNTIPSMFLDRIGGDLASLHCYFIILIRFIDQNIKNYVKIDNNCQNKNIIFMIKIWIFCVHYGFNTIPSMFLDRIGGGLASLSRYFIILSFYHVLLTEICRIISKSIMIVKIKILCLWLKCNSCVSIMNSMPYPNYSGWLNRFIWLFQLYFIILYWLKYVKIYH